MWAHKHVRLAVSLLTLSVSGILVGGRSLGEGTGGPAFPTVSETNRAFLARLARRTVRDAVLGRDVHAPPYVPESLNALTAEVIVRLRLHAYLRGTGVAGPALIAHATRDAALTAAAALKQNGVEPDSLDALLVEIEVPGPPEAIPVSADWTQPGIVDPYVEPGVHGVVLRGQGFARRVCPTELITSDVPLSDALRSLAQHTHTDPSQLSATQLMRFRTVHWYESAWGAPIVSLHRGLTLVPSEAVSPAGLDEAIARLAEYMVYRQRPSGLFTYQFEPGLDRYTDDDNVVRQVGAALAMAVHARQSGKSSSLAAADTAIRCHLHGLTDLPGVDNAAFIATADGAQKLGVTALLCIALAEHPQAEAYAATREKLINGMLWLQRPSGMFVTAFPPVTQLNAQDYFPGEALLALATEYDHQPSGRVLEAFDRAIGFYSDYFRTQRSPAFVPWQVQAFARMAKHSKRQDFVDYVFELTDWLAEKQLTSSNCEWPELRGGVAAQAPGRAGVATASYLEGFVDALTLARDIGDEDRVRRYQALVRDAARFVMQLQIRSEEAYFVRSPRDAVGGIRTAPALNRLRIDHCQHALIGLLKARQALFPPDG